MSVVDEVKQRLDIVDVVGQYVQLQKAGRNYKAICPFHSERTPSFFVSPERQSWHCFGACGSGGDIFSFVMKKENLEFADALRLLAERAGVTLAERRPEEEAARDRLREANEAAARFYHRTLLSNEAGQEARRYLEERGLDLNTIQEFQLGYSPSGWDSLCQHLREHGYSDEELMAAGLAVEAGIGRAAAVGPLARRRRREADPPRALAIPKPRDRVPLAFGLAAFALEGHGHAAGAALRQALHVGIAHRALGRHLHLEDLPRTEIGVGHGHRPEAQRDAEENSQGRPKNNSRVPEGDSPIFATRKLGQSPSCLSANSKKHAVVSHDHVPA